MAFRTVAVAFVVAVVVAGAPRGAAAQDRPTASQDTGGATGDAGRERAREAFAQGVRAAREGHWEDARASFSEAYALVQVPEILLNLAGAQRQTGHLVEAAESYRRFLALPEGETRAEHREAAGKALAALDPLMPHVTVSVDGLGANDRVELDGEPIAVDERLPVNPGQHAVVVHRDGIILEQRGFEVDAGESEELSVDVPRVPSPREAAEGAVAADAPPEGMHVGGDDDRSVVRSPWLWTGVGAVVVAGVVTAVVLAAGGDDAPDPFQGNVGPGTIEVP